MDTGAALAFAAVMLIVIVLVAAYVWYNFFGWTAFTYKTGDNPVWAPRGGADISNLRFKDCVFTVTRSDGKTVTLNTDPVLNSMAVAYKGGTSNPTSLSLTRPLNPFSFVITGFNDRATVPDPTVAPWCTSPPASCTADGGCPYGTPGSCGASGVCGSCPGGATVTLVGKVRTM